MAHFITQFYNYAGYEEVSITSQNENILNTFHVLDRKYWKESPVDFKEKEMGALQLTKGISFVHVLE